MKDPAQVQATSANKCAACPPKTAIPCAALSKRCAYRRVPLAREATGGVTLNVNVSCRGKSRRENTLVPK